MPRPGHTFDDDEPIVKPEPLITLTPEQLTDKLKEVSDYQEEQNKRLNGLRTGNVVGWIFVVLLSIVCAFLLTQQGAKPTKIVPSTLTVSQERLEATQDSAIKTNRDSLVALTRRFEAVEDRSITAIGMVEQRAKDLDELTKQVHRLDMKTPSPAQ